MIASVAVIGAIFIVPSWTGSIQPSKIAATQTMHQMISYDDRYRVHFSLPDHDYWKICVSHIVGRYSDTCLNKKIRDA